MECILTLPPPSRRAHGAHDSDRACFPLWTKTAQHDRSRALRWQCRDALDKTLKGRRPIFALGGVGDGGKDGRGGRCGVRGGAGSVLTFFANTNPKKVQD